MTPRSVLLDTNVVVAHFRADPDLTAQLKRTPVLYVPSVVLGELYYGACRAQRRDEQLLLIAEFLETAILLLPSDKTSQLYGQMKADLARAGKMIPDNDIWIAAMACEVGLPLVTRDAHFTWVPALETLQW